MSTRRVAVVPSASLRPLLAKAPLPLASGCRLMTPDAGPPAGDFHPINPRPCRAHTSGCTGSAGNGACLPVNSVFGSPSGPLGLPAPFPSSLSAGAGHRSSQDSEHDFKNMI